MVEQSRIRLLNPMPENARGRYVLYWMQQSQRVHYNHALVFAIQRANAMRLPLMVIFGLTDQYPEANARHYAFMLEGLAEVQQGLKRRGIAFKVAMGSPPEGVIDAARHAALVICDRGYLRHQRQWRQQVADAVDGRVYEVEADTVVPTQAVSHKTEYAARTIRPKILRELETYLHPLTLPGLKCKDPDLISPPDLAAIRKKLNVAADVLPVGVFLQGGRLIARRKLQTFTREILPVYAKSRNHPEIDGSSMLSPYLHFGQISPLEIALAVGHADAPREDRQAFLEELIVRRELAINYVCHHPDYDRYEGLPDWCRRTLSAHRKDIRDPIYTEKTLDASATHDPYWNTAMEEMKHTGFMHNYMRMYWGKKILQWTESPRKAFEIALRLNNRYFVDGRDANSYAGVGWIFGLHDRPWQERPIFGQIRYMARSGLERKFDMEGYVDKVGRRISMLRDPG